MPHFAPKMKIGSRMMFVTAPESVAAIAHAGEQSALITGLSIFISINTGKNARMILKYSKA